MTAVTPYRFRILMKMPNLLPSDFSPWTSTVSGASWRLSIAPTQQAMFVMVSMYSGAGAGCYALAPCNQKSFLRFVPGDVPLLLIPDVTRVDVVRWSNAIRPHKPKNLITSRYATTAVAHPLKYKQLPLILLRSRFHFITWVSFMETFQHPI